jgi:hypothetical protein
MHPQLEAINKQYLQIQDDLSDTNLQDEGEPSPQRKEALAIYHAASDQFVDIAPLLSPLEVIEAYQQGSDILRANLTGHMYHHFDDAYIPLMKRVIENDESDGAYFFLNALSDHLDTQEIRPLVLRALDSKFHRIRGDALYIAQELSIAQALPKVRAMVDDPNPGIAKSAQKVLALLTAEP